MNPTLSNDCDIPPFEEAVSKFQTFLLQQGVCENIRWLWRDAIFTGRGSGSLQCVNQRIFIDRRGLADNESVREYYNVGVARGLGVDLRVFCLVENVPLCYISIPADELAAQYAMVSSLRLSFPVPCPVATLVDYSWVFSTIMRLTSRGRYYHPMTNQVPLRPASAKKS